MSTEEVFGCNYEDTEQGKVRRVMDINTPSWRSCFLDSDEFHNEAPHHRPHLYLLLHLLLPLHQWLIHALKGIVHINQDQRQVETRETLQEITTAAVALKAEELILQDINHCWMIEQNILLHSLVRHYCHGHISRHLFSAKSFSPRILCVWISVRVH